LRSIAAINPLGRIRIATAGDLRSYVVRTTMLCVLAALAFDVVNQLVFFESWAAAFRSWLITVGVVVVIAAPVARTIGKAHLALFRASQTDPLTGLLNRRALLDGIDDGPAAMVLMIVDIDRFKTVNDTHGHLAGDEVLRAVGALMQRCLGDMGRVGRMGGEEFALIAQGRGDAAELLQRIEAFRATVEATTVITGAVAVAVTISAGIASRTNAQAFQQLYAEADRALYLAKSSGRNRVVVAGSSRVQAPEPIRLAG
jgi:diguanylate cyclase (GGDEF)-like protein